MDDKVSVVVPIYNVKDYLNICVGSISKQTYSNIEIVLVNDGSTDGSGIICQQLAQSDKRILVVNKINGGLSDARNAGINAASGSYIMFIDGDDWIDHDYVEQMMSAINTYRSDIAVLQMKKERQLGYYKDVSEQSVNWRTFNSTDALKILFTNNDIGYSACNKIYNINLFKKIRYPFGKLMEDKATTYKLIDIAKHGVSVSKARKYHYFMRKTSIMKQSFNPKRFDSFEIHNEILKYMLSYHPNMVELVKRRFVYESIRMMMFLIESDNRDRKNYARCLSVIYKYGGWGSGRDINKSFLYGCLVKLILIFPGFPRLLARLSLVRLLFRKLELN